MDTIAATSRALGLLVVVLASVSPASAQAAPMMAGSWRIGASAGGWVPFSSLIRAADSFDTRLAAGPAFAIEPRYLASNAISLFVNGTAAFSTISPGSSIRPDVAGSSDFVALIVGTAGLMLTGDGWLGEYMEPTLRVGGGFKWYGFDLTGAQNGLRPTADVGIGLRGIGIGPIEVTTEVRYLPSSFDQSRLPTRGIATQNQRQTDVIFSIGFAIRPG